MLSMSSIQPSGERMCKGRLLLPASCKDSHKHRQKHGQAQQPPAPLWLLWQCQSPRAGAFCADTATQIWPAANGWLIRYFQGKKQPLSFTYRWNYDHCGMQQCVPTPKGWKMGRVSAIWARCGCSMLPAASVADQPGTPAASAAFLPGESRPGSPGPPAEEAGRVPGWQLIWCRAEVYLPASALGPGAPRPPCRPLERQIGGHVGAWGELKVSRQLCFKRTGLVHASGLLSPVGVPCCSAGLCGDGAVLPGGPRGVWQTEVAWPASTDSTSTTA